MGCQFSVVGFRFVVVGLALGFGGFGWVRLGLKGGFGGFDWVRLGRFLGRFGGLAGFRWVRFIEIQFDFRDVVFKTSAPALFDP